MLEIECTDLVGNQFALLLRKFAFQAMQLRLKQYIPSMFTAQYRKYLRVHQLCEA